MMNIMDLGFMPIPAIVVICYALAELVKSFDINNKFIPTICMILGGLLGIVEMNVNASSVSGDFLSAVAIGVISGLSATGVHQAITQLAGKKADEGE